MGIGNVEVGIHSTKLNAICEEEIHDSVRDVFCIFVLLLMSFSWVLEMIGMCTV